MGSSAHGSAAEAPIAFGHAPHDPPKGGAMGFLKRFRHQDEPEEQTCPHCRMPAPADAEECPECGWDLHEAYRPVEPAPETHRA